MQGSRCHFGAPTIVSVEGHHLVLDVGPGIGAAKEVKSVPRSKAPAAVVPYDPYCRGPQARAGKESGGVAMLGRRWRLRFRSLDHQSRSWRLHPADRVLRRADHRRRQAAARRHSGSPGPTIPAGASVPMSCQKTAGTLDCSTHTLPVKLPPNLPVTIHMSITPGGAGGLTAIKNCATLAGSNEPQCVTMPLRNGPLIRAFKSTAATTCVPNCFFGIAIENIGNAIATGPFTLDDVFTPPGIVGDISKVDGDFNCNRTGSTLVCTSTKNELKPGEFARGRVVVGATQTAPEYTNCANVRPDNGLNVDTDFQGHRITFKDVPQPKIKIVKVSTSNGVCDLTKNCPFRITITNVGAGALQGDLNIGDTVAATSTAGVAQSVPAGVENIADPNWSCTKPDVRTITCKNPKGLAPGASVTLDILVTPGPSWKKNDILENCAVFSGILAPGSSLCASVKLDPFAAEASPRTGAQSCQPGGELPASTLDIFDPGPDSASQRCAGHGRATISTGHRRRRDRLDHAGLGRRCLPVLARRRRRCPSAAVRQACGSRSGERDHYTMVVELPADAAAQGSFSNCASVANPGGTEAAAPCRVRPPPAARLPPINHAAQLNLAPGCTGGMEMNADGRCACPPGTSWDGKACSTGSGGTDIDGAANGRVPGL